MAETLKQQMIAFHKKATEKGSKLTSYVCPHCNKTVDTLQPKHNEVTAKGYWDSLKRCYECDMPSFVSVYPNGTVVVSALEIPAHVC